MRRVTHSSILAWRIPRTEEPGKLRARGSELDTPEWLSTCTWTVSRAHPDTLGR